MLSDMRPLLYIISLLLVLVLMMTAVPRDPLLLLPRGAFCNECATCLRLTVELACGTSGHIESYWLTSRLHGPALGDCYSCFPRKDPSRAIEA